MIYDITTFYCSLIVQLFFNTSLRDQSRPSAINLQGSMKLSPVVLLGDDSRTRHFTFTGMFPVGDTSCRT